MLPSGQPLSWSNTHTNSTLDKSSKNPMIIFFPCVFNVDPLAGRFAQYPDLWSTSDWIKKKKTQTKSDFVGQSWTMVTAAVRFLYSKCPQRIEWDNWHYSIGLKCFLWLNRLNDRTQCVSLSWSVNLWLWPTIYSAYLSCRFVQYDHDHADGVDGFWWCWWRSLAMMMIMMNMPNKLYK